MSLSIHRSLQAVMLVLAVFGAAGGGIATHAIRQLAEAIHGISEEHVGPLMQLKAISDAYAVTIVDTTHKTAAQTMSWEDGVKSVRDSEAIVLASWKAFRKKSLAPEEKTIAGEYSTMMEKAAPFLSKIIKTMEAKDEVGLKGIAAKELYPIIDPLTEKIDGLIKFQLKAIEGQMNAAEREGAIAVAFQIAGGGVLLFVLVLGLIVVTRQVIQPLTRIRSGMVKLASGDTSVEFPDARRNNELGEMARSVEMFRENELERRRIEIRAREERQQEIKRQTGVERIVTEFRNSITEVRRTLDAEFGTMRDASGNLTGIASQAANGVVAAREAADFSSANISTVRNAANELTEASRQISEQVDKANDRVCMAMEAAKRTDRDISGLADLAGKVGAIVGIINTIAEQTNMLALNATIEAARAGDAGRSFAVVASEVKTLADQTAKATEEISAQIVAIQSATGQAVSSIHEITEAVAEIELQTSAIATAVSAQETSTHEIARSITAASEGSQRAASNVSGVTQSIDRTAQQASRLAGVSDQLGHAAATLSRSVDSFLADIAADIEARRNETRRVMRQLTLIDGRGRRMPGELLAMDSRSAQIDFANPPEIGTKMIIEFSMGERVEAVIHAFSGGSVELSLARTPDQTILQRVA